MFVFMKNFFRKILPFFRWVWYTFPVRLGGHTSSRKRVRPHEKQKFPASGEAIGSYFGSGARNALSQAAQDLGAAYSQEFATFSLDYDKDWNPLPHPCGESYYRLCAAGGFIDPSGAISFRAGADLSNPDDPSIQRASLAMITGRGNVDQMFEILYTTEIECQELN